MRPGLEFLPAGMRESYMCNICLVHWSGSANAASGATLPSQAGSEKGVSPPGFSASTGI